MAVSIDLLNELVDRFHKGAEANRQTRGRKGSLVRLGPDQGDEVMWAGDLHGNRVNLVKLLREAKLDDHPRRHLVLQEVVHGGPTYPGGGDMSHLMLEEVAELKVRYPDRFHFLLCNHELSECTNVSISKGGVSQNHRFAVGLEHAYGVASGRIAECYHAFIRSCPLAVRLKNGVFISHSVPDGAAIDRFDPNVFARDPNSEDLRAGGSAYALVWGRDYAEEHVRRFLRMVRSTVLLTGHEPSPRGFERPNGQQIVLDCSGPECWRALVPVDHPVTADELAANLTNLK